MYQHDERLKSNQTIFRIIYLFILSSSHSNSVFISCCSC